NGQQRGLEVLEAIQVEEEWIVTQAGPDRPTAGDGDALVARAVADGHAASSAGCTAARSAQQRERLLAVGLQASELDPVGDVGNRVAVGADLEVVHRAGPEGGR